MKKIEPYTTMYVGKGFNSILIVLSNNFKEYLLKNILL